MSDIANTARKSLFFEENPKAPPISKFQRAPLFQFEFETTKELLLSEPWKVADQKNELSPRAKYNYGNPVKIKEILFAKG